MTLNEFKAWFEGFTEAIDKAPTQKQWARIKERVADIDGHEVTERIFIDRYQRYVPSYPPNFWWTGTPYFNTMGTQCSGTGVSDHQVTSNSAMLMNAVGVAEAQEING